MQVSEPFGTQRHSCKPYLDHPSTLSDGFLVISISKDSYRECRGKAASNEGKDKLHSVMDSEANNYKYGVK